MPSLSLVPARYIDLPLPCLSKSLSQMCKNWLAQLVQQWVLNPAFKKINLLIIIPHASAELDVL